MIHAALLVAALVFNADTATATENSSNSPKTAIQQCFATMDGAVYHGDPSNRELMKANVAACERGIIQIGRMRPGVAHGPEKLFLTARILDRAATLSYMGLDDANTALREVKTANLYFRIASGLPKEPANYLTAALANAELTAVQLRTLRSEIASARSARSSTIAVRTGSAKARGSHPRRRTAPAVYTAYHKL